jgi:hypothetical protein
VSEIRFVLRGLAGDWRARVNSEGFAQHCAALWGDVDKAATLWTTHPVSGEEGLEEGAAEAAAKVEGVFAPVVAERQEAAGRLGEGVKRDVEVLEKRAA